LREEREPFLLQAGREVRSEERAKLAGARASSGVLLRNAWRVTSEDWIRSAWFALFAGDPQGFEEALRRAIEIGGDRADLHYDLGRFLLVRGRSSDAAAEFESSLADRPNAPVFDRLARLYFSEGRNMDALRTLTRALESFPDHPDLLFNLGVLNSLLGNHAAATQAFERVLVVSPERKDARENLAALRERLGQESR
jgi:tetratricopeptide (TPR) repeat protein